MNYLRNGHIMDSCNVIMMLDPLCFPVLIAVLLFALSALAIILFFQRSIHCESCVFFRGCNN